MEEEKQLKVNETEQNLLVETAKWTRILGVLYAVCLVMMVVLGLVYIISGILSDGSGTLKSASFISGIIFILSDVLVFFPTKYLLKSGKKLDEAVRLGNQESFSEGIRNSKSYFKFTAICCLVVLPLSLVLGLIGGILSVL